MSRDVLRFLSPARTSSPSRSRRTIRITPHIPSYGSIFMTAPGLEGEEPPKDRDLSGELEIEVPIGMGRRRCRAVRVGLRSVCRLFMGPERGWEEDVLFERKVEVRGAIILHEGVQRFDFTIVVPYQLAAHDWHPEGRITIDLYAEVEGLATRSLSSAMSPSPVGTPRRGRSPSRSSNRRGVSAASNSGGMIGGSASVPSTSRSGSTTPSNAHAAQSQPPPPQQPVPYSAVTPGSSMTTGGPTTPEDLDPNEPPTWPIATQMVISWSDPVASSSEGEVKWLKGVHEAKRSITLLYNPDPNNGISTLDARRHGQVPSLGAFEVRYSSDIWTVCAPMRVYVHIPAPSTSTTVFYARVMLNQTTSIRSPRDDADPDVVPLVSTTSFGIWSQGQRPPPVRPGRDTPALWRGTDAQGSDGGSLTMTGIGRLPNDETGRPSTVHGIITPIRVTHSLILEVWYSVWSEDHLGEPLPHPGQGRLRVLRVDKPVVVPSCAFIPENLDLPTYESHNFDTAPCRLCKMPPDKQTCQTCPLTSVPHPRHDHDPALVGNPNGVCRLCTERIITDDKTGKWKDCACGLSLHDLELRMSKVAIDAMAELGTGGTQGDGDGDGGQGGKPERGRAIAPRV